MLPETSGEFKAATCFVNPLKPNDLKKRRTAQLTLHFMYLFNKYTY